MQAGTFFLMVFLSALETNEVKLSDSVLPVKSMPPTYATILRGPEEWDLPFNVSRSMASVGPISYALDPITQLAAGRPAEPAKVSGGGCC